MPESRAKLEEALHCAVVEFLQLARPACIWYHVPNGEKRDKITAAKLARMGVRAGVSDFTFEAGRFVGHIELKAPRGSLSKDQVAFRDECQERGIAFAVAFEVMHVHDILVQWGLLRPGRFEFRRAPDLVLGVTA